jgi:hypothetical protein
LQFPEIAGIWIISEKHLATMPGKTLGSPRFGRNRPPSA